MLPVSATPSPVTVLPESKQNGDAIMNAADPEDVLLIMNNKSKFRNSQVSEI